MSLTIADLKYQNNEVALHRYIRDNYSWLYGFTIVNGVKGKTTVSGIDITGPILVPQTCETTDIDSALVSKEVELDEYNLTFPISDCDLEDTWLNGFARKYEGTEEVYIDFLVPYLAEMMGSELKAKVYESIFAEATADADVTKVVVSTAATDAETAYGNIVEFVNGFTEEFDAHALDYDNWENYKVEVSPQIYKYAIEHTEKLGKGSYGFTVGGYQIVANSQFTGNEMICTNSYNKLIVFDATEDLSKIKIIRKEWLSLSYIQTGLAFKASYNDSSRIIISSAT